MAKCVTGCTCKRHVGYSKKCEPGCECDRHKPNEIRNQKVSAAQKGRPLSAEHRAALKCQPGCECGKHALRNSGQFQPGSVGFTGRHSAETKAKLATYTGESASAYKHGWSQTPTYKSWHAMLGRCYDEGNASFPFYGGRGITVCERWHDFMAFLEDMGERPSPNHSIDRYPNRRGNYESGNCRWATRAEQAENRDYNDAWVTRRARYGPSGRKAS